MTSIKNHPNEYKIYRAIMKNCYPGQNCSSSYEKNRIGICSEWIKGGFKAFLDDMGTKPSDKHKLLRKDPKKDFCKDNCEWSLDTPRRTDNIMITLDGITRTLYYWCNKYNLDYGNTHRKIKKKYRHLTPEDVIKKILNIF